MLYTINISPAGAVPLVGHLASNQAPVGSTPIACSKLSGNLGGTGPAKRGQGVGGRTSDCQSESQGSTPCARSYSTLLEVPPAGSVYMLGRPVTWRPLDVMCVDGSGAGHGTVSKTELQGFDSLPVRQGRDQQQFHERH